MPICHIYLHLKIVTSWFPAFFKNISPGVFFSIYIGKLSPTELLLIDHLIKKKNDIKIGILHIFAMSEEVIFISVNMVIYFHVT